MVKRKLPAASQRNPQLTDEHTPQHEILVERRRLGQTDLKAPGSPGTSKNATSVGIFDYAHLRVPLPQDLQKSGIFTPLKNGQYPESYFLMRRSSDGYISATGLFKAAYPYSSAEEEQSERKHHKSLSTGGGEEIAGNVWISPKDALHLADEYAIRPWILALLDSEPIDVGTKEKNKGHISSPPSFDLSSSEKLAAPAELSAPTPKSRSKRSVSPSKSSAAPRKTASPRKKRQTSTKPEGVIDEVVKTARKASSKLQDKLVNGTSDSQDGTVEATTSSGAPETIRVEVNETIEKKDDGKEVSHTTVSVAMPASHPDLPMPEDTTAMLAKAKEMVAEANKLEKRVTKNKRKASANISKEDVDNALQPVPKKARTELQEKLVTERVRTRALVGLTATLVVGAIIPYFL